MMKNKKVRVIIIIVAALTACAGAVCLFMKRRKRIFYTFTAAAILCGIIGAGITVYADEPDITNPEMVIADTDYDTEPDEDITADETDGEFNNAFSSLIEMFMGEDFVIDIGDFLSPDFQPSQLTPPGNLTLIDDLSGIQTLDKQFITVTTRNGNYFYIIIDRAGERENVHFLNLVDEYSLLQILQGEDAPTPPLPANIADIAGEPERENEKEEAADTPQPRENNNTGLLIMLVVIAAVGGGAFYYFKVLKPKRGNKKATPIKNELDEFDFDADEDELFSDSADEPDSENYINTAEQDNSDYSNVNDDYNFDNENSNDSNNSEDEKIPDFTAKDEPDKNGGDFIFTYDSDETPENKYADE